jgi:hypothetical protein
VLRLGFLLESFLELIFYEERMAERLKIEIWPVNASAGVAPGWREAVGRA